MRIYIKTICIVNSFSFYFALYPQEVRKEFDDGRQNYSAFVELHKTVAGDEVLDEKKAAEVENDVNGMSGRVQQLDKVLHEQETK